MVIVGKTNTFKLVEIVNKGGSDGVKVFIIGKLLPT